ncbi:hypothetical protein HOG48_00400 [Candidatus Peregrinibacteria bacterium]|jgi:hypothetical protein|nr:hypothetical protein [Candidatus Peregrinibacteria bacterium]
MLIKGLILTLIIEAIVINNRFWFGSMKNFIKKRKKYIKFRIHHGYTGIIMMIIYLFYPIEEIFIIGFAFFLSDVIHHAIVLPIWTGKTEFP